MKSDGVLRLNEKYSLYCTGQGVDQLAEVIKKIKENPTDRRIVMSAWNPTDLGSMALPPCHMFCQVLKSYLIYCPH